jgi:hypothetical protein
MRTLSLVATIIPAMIGIVFVTAALRLPGKNRDAGWWAAGFLIQALGFFLIFLRGSIPDLVSVPLANELIVAGLVVLLWGIDAHTASSPRPVLGLSLIAASMVVFAVLTVMMPAWKIIALTVSTMHIAVNALLGARLLALRGETRPERRLTAGIFLASAAVWLARAILIIAGPAQSGLFVSSPSSIIAFLDSFLLPVCIAVGFFSMVARKLQVEREHTIRELESALGKVQTLSGLLPICASCKKIRDENGHWGEVEVYVRDHSNAEFTHSICPECTEKLYPEVKKRG